VYQDNYDISLSTNPKIFILIKSNYSAIGSNVISVTNEVDWIPGDEIIVTTTTFAPRQTEKFIITNVFNGGKSLQLKQVAQYTHSAFQMDINNKTITMSAKVGLLTRNIQIKGINEPAGSLLDQSFGCRVLVSQHTQNGLTYKGRAQFEEVQFSHCGQFGFTGKYDPRYFVT